MHLSVIANIVQEAGPTLPKTTIAFYGLGAAAGAIICVIVWFARDAWERRVPRAKGPTAEVQPAPEGELPSDDAAQQKKPRKMTFRDLLYIAGIYFGTDLIAKGAAGIFPGIPAEAVVWGVLTGFVLCLMILIGARNLGRKKTSTDQQT